MWQVNSRILSQSEVEQVHQSGIREALQGLLVVLLAGEGVLVAAAFQRTAAAVPGVAEPFFKARRSVCRQAVLPVAASKAA